MINLRSGVIAFLLWVSWLVPVQATEEQISIKNFTLYQGESAGWLIADIDLEYHLSPYLEQSLENGISLRNEIRFDLIWHSEWWWNETRNLDSIVVELKRDAISRKFQVISKNSGKNWNFSNLTAALEHIGKIHQYALPALPEEAFGGDAAIYVQATMAPKTSKLLDIPSKLSSLFSSNEDRQLVSPGVMWPLTP